MSIWYQARGCFEYNYSYRQDFQFKLRCKFARKRWKDSKVGVNAVVRQGVIAGVGIVPGFDTRLVTAAGKIPVDYIGTGLVVDKNVEGSMNGAMIGNLNTGLSRAGSASASTVTD